jgi:hypothetical protein
MKSIPEIRFIFSYLLYFGESRTIYDAKKLDQEYPTLGECIEKTNQYEKAWRTKEQTIIKGLCELYGLEFYKPIIDVSVAPYFVPKSEPLTVNFNYDPDLTLDIIAHELLHVLFTDNTKTNKAKSGVNLFKAWEDICGTNHERQTLVHIPIHAGLKALYLDILNEPARLERDIGRCSKWPGYKAAWDYVQANDYKEINKKITRIYS